MWVPPSEKQGGNRQKVSRKLLKIAKNSKKTRLTGLEPAILGLTNLRCIPLKLQINLLWTLQESNLLL